MSANQGGNVQLSQGYEVLPPKTGKAYPILCEEWDYLKAKIKNVSDGPWIFQAIGFLLMGAALSTFIAILLGTFPSDPNSRAIVVAWAIVAVGGICGVVCLFFADQHRRVRHVQVSDVVTQMELIEKRYERDVG